MKKRFSDLRYSMSGRIILSYITIGLIPILLLGMFGFSYFSGFIQTRTIEYLRNTQQNFRETVTNDITAMTAQLDSLQNYMPSARIPDLLSSIEDEKSNESLQMLMNILLQTNVNTENVIAVNASGAWEHMSRYKKYPYLEYEFSNGELINEIKALGADASALPLHHSQGYFNNMNEYVISVAKNFYNENEYAGSIIVDINPTYFSKLLQNGEKNVHITMTDKNNFCIYSSHARDIDTYIDTNGAPVYTLEHDFSNSLPRPDTFYIETDICNVWKLLMRVNRSDLTSETDMIQQIFYITLLFIAAILILLSLFYSKLLSAPVTRMVKQMHTIRNGKLNIRLTEEKVTELSQIASGVNEMLDDLDMHIRQTYSARIKQKEAELNALKMQINPHFLYNMLELINATAIEQNASQVSSMIISLASQLRYMLSDNNDFVTIREEIDIVHHYFTFVNMRYEENILLNINIADSLKEYKIMKFVLQPLIENAVKHGYNPERKLVISVNIMLSSDKILIIDIVDNGNGMDEEHLLKLRKQLESEEKDTKSENIGLKNVCRRLQFFYGPQFNAEIDSFKELGTSIRLKIPMSEKGEAK